MSYVKRPQFDQPSVEDIQRTRRSMVWMLPAFLVQQASFMIGGQLSVAEQVLHLTAWCALTVSILWFLAGWRLRWMSEEDNRLLDDEWNRAARGEANCWGMIALVAVGCGLLIATIWTEINIRLAIDLLVGMPLAVAVARFGWLNRGEPDEDD
jgi:hypothetical protein